MVDQPGPVREGEQLDRGRLQAYLQQTFPQAHGELTIEQFRSGYSNLTYRLTFDGLDLVLRRPPFGNPVRSAHDMGREYRVLSKLHRVYPPAPRPLVYCDDPDVMGDSFYVMERRHGVIFRGPQTPAALAGNPQQTRQVCESLIDNLARLHTLDFRAAGLGDLGRPEGYVKRQVTGWAERYQRARTDAWPQLEQLADWLARQRPASAHQALIHNDYKYDNVMFAADCLPRVVAVLDWEMATLGDPLMDLGTCLAYWVEPSDPESLQALAFGPTMAPGSLTREQLIERYQETTGYQVEHPLFYYVFGLYKLAVIVQQIYARYVRGHTRDPRFAKLNQAVRCLGRVGMEAIESGAISRRG